MSHDSTSEALSSVPVLPSRLVISIQRVSAASCVDGHTGTAVIAGHRAALLVPPVHRDLLDPELVRGTFLLVVGLPDPTTDTVLRVPIQAVHPIPDSDSGDPSTIAAVAEFDLPGWPARNSSQGPVVCRRPCDRAALAEVAASAVQPDQVWLSSIDMTTRRPPRTGGDETLYGCLRTLLRSPITADLARAIGL